MKFDYSHGVSFCQSIRGVLQVTQKLRQISLFFVNQMTQREAVDELHGDEVRIITLTNFIDGGDVRMIERRRCLRLLFEPPHPIVIRCEVRRKNLQCHFPVKLSIFCEINLAHSALADLRADFVAPQFCAEGNTHCGLAEIFDQDHIARHGAARER